MQINKWYLFFTPWQRRRETKTLDKIIQNYIQFMHLYRGQKETNDRISVPWNKNTMLRALRFWLQTSAVFLFFFVTWSLTNN